MAYIKRIAQIFCSIVLTIGFICVSICLPLGVGSLLPFPPGELDSFAEGVIRWFLGCGMLAALYGLIALVRKVDNDIWN